MSNITGVFRGRATLEAGFTPTIHNVSVPLANTEVSQALGPSAVKFTIKVRGNATMRVAFNSGDTATTYLTVPAGAVYSEDLISFSGSIYFQTNKASQIVEIVEWA
jgi:hypothetical protein